MALVAVLPFSSDTGSALNASVKGAGNAVLSLSDGEDLLPSPRLLPAS